VTGNHAKSREFYLNSGHSPELRHEHWFILWFRSFTEITMYMMPGQLIFISWFRWNEIVTANLAKSRELCRNSCHSPALRYR
jgi:hypothetical protein